MRLKFWLDQLLSTKSLATTGLAAAGLVGWVTTHNPAFGWVMLGGGGAWTAMMYYLLGTAKGDNPALPKRGDAIRAVEQAIRQFPMPRDEGERARWRSQEKQLRRIADLERLVLTELSTTSSGVELLSVEQQLDVTEIVDQAVELAKRRALLLRALLANPLGTVESEARRLIGQRQTASQRVLEELDELIALKREQAERIRRWRDDLHLTEIHLDQIETFVRALAYDHAVTPTNVGERIVDLKTKVQARRESVEELERRLSQAAG